MCPAAKLLINLVPSSKTCRRAARLPGSLEGGEGWYRKHFRLADLHGLMPASKSLSTASICDSQVWLNGHKPWQQCLWLRPLCVRPHASFSTVSGDNVLAVRVQQPRARTVAGTAGSGIYRQVQASTSCPPAARIARWGVAAWTRQHCRRQRRNRHQRRGSSSPIRLCVWSPGFGMRAGKVVAATKFARRIGSRSSRRFRCGAPRLWSPASPALYMLETELQARRNRCRSDGSAVRYPHRRVRSRSRA